MKNEESLRSSYQKQLSIFNEAKAKRIQNRQQQILILEQKITTLQSSIQRLKTENANEREFETFESFRTKAQSRSLQSKN